MSRVTGRRNTGHKAVPTKRDNIRANVVPSSRIIDAQEDVVETYGPCIKFHRCTTVGVLGNGLCINCWDTSNMYNGRADNDERAK